jgi:hypothetical protein
MLFCIILHVAFLLCHLLFLLLLVWLTLLLGTNLKISRWWRTGAPCHKGVEQNGEGRNRECSESRQTNWCNQSPGHAQVSSVTQSDVAMLARAGAPAWH